MLVKVTTYPNMFLPYPGTIPVYRAHSQSSMLNAVPGAQGILIQCPLPICCSYWVISNTGRRSHAVITKVCMY